VSLWKSIKKLTPRKIARVIVSIAEWLRILGVDEDKPKPRAPRRIPR
jgi:hypothetical protein